MKSKYLAPALAIPALALTLWGASAVSAYGGWGGIISPEEVVKHQQTMFESHAEILGLNVSEVKDAWAQGKNLKELATEKGISEADLKTKLQAERKKQHEEHLKALVDGGVITQAQADQRLKFIESRPEGQGMKGKGHRGGMMGQGMGFSQSQQ